MEDVLLNKAAVIERCIKRINEEYIGHDDEFENNLMRQDSIIYNLQRACGAAIYIGIHLIKTKQLGIPQSSCDVFALLETASIIDKSLSQSLQAVVDFRDIAIHDYRKMDLAIARHIIKEKLADLSAFAKIGLKTAIP